VAIARGRRPEVEDNGAFTSLLVTTAIAGGIWLAMGTARGFAPVTTRALLWFAGAGVLTAYVGRVAFYATVERLGAMRAATKLTIIGIAITAASSTAVINMTGISNMKTSTSAE